MIEPTNLGATIGFILLGLAVVGLMLILFASAAGLWGLGT